MIDLTNDQWREFYGLEFDENGDTDGAPRGWKPDFTKWVAVLWEENTEDSWWCIAPKPFWGANRCIPDHCIGFEVPGFWESTEHTLDSENDLLDQEEALKQLGFEVMRDAEWR